MQKPSAWFAVALSFVMFMIMLSFIFIFGIVEEADEGVGAHLFQIWLVVEACMIAFFLIKWLPQKPKQAFLILAIQMIAVIAVCTPVFYFKL